MVRLCRPRKEVPDGTWTFPEAQRVKQPQTVLEDDTQSFACVGPSTPTRAEDTGKQSPKGTWSAQYDAPGHSAAEIAESDVSHCSPGREPLLDAFTVG
jgi:hypothetical protein